MMGEGDKEIKIDDTTLLDVPAIIYFNSFITSFNPLFIDSLCDCLIFQLYLVLLC